MALSENTISEVPNIFPVIVNNGNTRTCETNSQVSKFPGNNSVNVENSNEIIFGDVTQFHGPVNIYQTATNNSHTESKTEKQNCK